MNRIIAELTTLNFMIARARPHERIVLLRSAVCILYAHWEGFIKAASISYVSFVASRGLRYRDLSTNFIALGLRSDIMRAGQAINPMIHTGLVEQFTSGLAERAVIDDDNAVSTHSNLNAKTLSEILTTLGFDGTNYLTRGPLLDQKLLSQRNLIAHGARVEIEQDDYSVLHGEIIQLVEQFRTDVENAAATNRYRGIQA
jgi:hypothetical protein